MAQAPPSAHEKRAGSPMRTGPACLVGAIGLEPTTPTMSRWCSNQLSYAPEFVFEAAIVAKGCSPPRSLTACSSLPPEGALAPWGGPAALKNVSAPLRPSHA